MAEELTYILGAGASYQSIPVVKTFSRRFEEFLGYCRSIGQDVRLENEYRQNFELVYDIGNPILNAFVTHQSFDTYFKKLFHLGLDNEILRAKKLLNLYFLWEHLSNPQNEPEIEPFNEKTKRFFWKQSRIDKRYDALIAGILKPEFGKAETYCRVNFITWNYDLNLIASIKNYYSPNSNLSDFIKKIEINNNQWLIENQISIINLNGYFYSSSIGNFVTFQEHNPDKIHQLIYRTIRDNNLRNNLTDSDAEKIKFAWESSVDVGKIAMEKINESRNIVVIGYTFPLYNRLTDFEYFNMEQLKNKNIFIQDPRANEIVKSVIEDFSLNIDDSNEHYYSCKVNAVTNCESFLIPSDIFRYKDSLNEI